MARKKDQLPKTQQQLRQDTIQPYDPSGGPTYVDPKKKRALNNRVDNTTVKPLTVGLKDIDEAIVYYFTNVIKPSVIQNGNRIPVPIIYGSPERWSSVQKDGYYRDKNGKIMTPLIMFKRDSVEKNRNLGNKLDANLPRNIQFFEVKHSKKNIYDSFSVLTNRKPVAEYYGVVIPDYVTVTYSCVLFTDYVEQMNKLVESINYASDAYWGDPERFKFQATIDTYNTSVELTKGNDRAVKTTFTLKLAGHIIPDSINTEPIGSRRVFSKSRILFNLETQSNLELLLKSANTPLREAPRRFYDNPDTFDESTLSDEEIIFVFTSNSALSDETTLNQALFFGKVFLKPPPGYTLDENSFNVYVNGISINPFYVQVEEYEGGIRATFNSTSIGYNVKPSDTVVLTGKFK